jgi:uncharacterized C2H2 Zn-finger protein
MLDHADNLTRKDTGLRPFSCPRCNREFSRQDSLARHFRSHSRVQGHAEQAIGTVSASRPCRWVSDPSGSCSADLDSQSPLGEAQIELLEHQASNAVPPTNEATALTEQAFVDNSTDPFLQLTWPDSEDLLHSILSANLGPWPQSWEAVPPQLILATGNQGSGQVQSPWLTSATDGSTDHAGNHAVRNLTQMITSLVSQCTAIRHLDH